MLVYVKCWVRRHSQGFASVATLRRVETREFDLRLAASTLLITITVYLAPEASRGQAGGQRLRISHPRCLQELQAQQTSAVATSATSTSPAASSISSIKCLQGPQAQQTSVNPDAYNGDSTCLRTSKWYYLGLWRNNTTQL